MAAEQKQEFKYYVGGSHTKYVEIARRGETETIAVSVLPGNKDEVLILQVRFMARTTGDGFQPFTHFTPRGVSRYHSNVGEGFKGLQLNKLEFPLASPAFPKHQLEEAFDKLDLWDIIAGWLAEQIKAETGFELLQENLIPAVKCMFGIEETAPFDTSTTKLSLDFPDLKLEKEAGEYDPSKDESLLEMKEDHNMVTSGFLDEALADDIEDEEDEDEEGYEA